MCPDELFVYGRINGLNGLKEKEQDKINEIVKLHFDRNNFVKTFANNQDS